MARTSSKTFAASSSPSDPAASGHQRKTQRLGRLAVLVAASSMLYGCTGGLSCGGNSGCVNAYDYPQSGLTNGVASVDDGARLRMTQAGLDYLKTHLQEILIGTLGGQNPANPNLIEISLGNFTLVDDDASVTLSLGQDPDENGDGTPDREGYDTKILIDVEDFADRLTFEFIEGGQEGIRVRAEDVPVGLDTRIYTVVNALDFGLGFAPTAACNVNGTNDAYGPGIITGLTVEALILPDVGTGADCDPGVAECLKLAIDVIEVDLDPRDTLGGTSLEVTDAPICTGPNTPSDCSLECSDPVFIFDPDGNQECEFFCPVYDFAGTILVELANVIEGLIQPFIDNLLDLALRQALEEFDGSPLAVSSRFEIRAAAPGLVNETTHDLGYSVAPTGSAFDVNCAPGTDCETALGMDFILKTGVEAAPDLEIEGETPSDTPIPHPCVNGYVGADFANLFGDGEFRTPDANPLTGVFDGEPYHLGMSLARATMNQALFGVYNSGSMCIELTTDAVHGLTGGAFPLSAGTLDLLTEGQLRQYTSPSSPAVATMTPNAPPVITFGAGTEDEGHIIFDWPNVDVGFYVLAYERFTRVFSVNTRIHAEISVFHDPATGVLRFAIVNGPSVTDFEETYNELLPGVAFSEVLDSLIGLGFDALLGDGLEFDLQITTALSDLIGAPVYIDFRGIETTQEGEFLNVYLAMTDTLPQPRTFVPPTTFTLAPNAGLYRLKDNPRLPGVATPIPTGQVRLEGALVPLGRDVEYFYQVDFGTWRGPIRPDDFGALLLDDKKLAFVGEHTIALRGRTVGDSLSLQDTPDFVSVWVDPSPPQVTLEHAGEVLVAHGEDLGTNALDLEYAWRVDDEPFGDFSRVSIRSVSDFDGARKVSVMALDRAGNISIPRTIDLGQAANASGMRTATPAPVARQDAPPPMAAGCSQSTSSSSSFFGLLLLAVLGWRRSRRG